MQKEPMVNLVYATPGHVLLLWWCKTNGSHDKLPWGNIKELVADGDDKEVMLANKAVDLSSTSTIFSRGGIANG